MKPSVPLRIIRRLPFGQRMALRLYNRLLMHLAPRHRVRTWFDAELDCDVHDMIQATLIHFKAWEPNTSRLLEVLVRPGDIIVDVGANIGYYSLLFSRLVGPSGHVVAIEALPKLAAVLEGHVGRDGSTNVRVVNVAVAERPGSVTLYEAPATNIGMTTTREDRGFPAATAVQALPLTDILSPDELAGVSLIKIDIEGAEGPVVRKLLDDIERFPSLQSVAIEVSPDAEWRTLFDRFTQLGFGAWDLRNSYDWLGLLHNPFDPPRRLSALPQDQVDVLFTRRELSEPAVN